jgi:RNA polymerase sigma-70 factor (ECF subfamily)
VFNLFCMEGWSHRDIGLKLGIGEKSSSSQYSRARALLAKRIKEYWYEQEG